MIEQARGEFPNECCGLLAGELPAPGPPSVGLVRWRYPLVNAEAVPTRFISTPESMFAAARDMRERRLEILAVYHSHPISDPIPSRTDLECNYSTEVVNFIISMKEAEPRVRAWWLTADGYREAEWEVVEEEVPGRDGEAESGGES
jgi:proteasome lid subunit RPN8/RPN11